jgi:hypothetical protein
MSASKSNNPPPPPPPPSAGESKPYFNVNSLSGNSSGVFSQASTGISYGITDNFSVHSGITKNAYKSYGSQMHTGAPTWNAGFRFNF